MFVSCPYFCLFYFFGFNSNHYNHIHSGCGACCVCELDIIPVQ